MDNVDVKIIECLRENARMNASQIGDRIKMSVSAVIERIKKLEAGGVIKQYTVVLDSKAIGRETMAFISISLEHPKYNETFIERVNRNNEITECHYITGDFDFLIKVMTDSTQSLERILNDIKSIKGVSLTRTLVALSTAKQEYAVISDKI